MQKVFIRRNEYFDSVFLMQLGAQLRRQAGIEEINLLMATPHNVAFLESAGYRITGETRVTESDLIIAVSAESLEAIEQLRPRLKELLTRRGGERGGGGEIQPRSLRSAFRARPGANLVLISVPGHHAPTITRRALNAGRHVMLFSDNVPLEDEVALKKLALERGLLLMGPDCGTAIINGAPLGFANRMRPGAIGIVGASGTGIQEICASIDRFGGGISHALGVGGRDLSLAVGGMMSRVCFQALVDDPRTEVIVFVSKLPHPRVEKALAAMMRESPKPVVVRFIGRRRRLSRKHYYHVATLEEAGHVAVEVLNGRKPRRLGPGMERETMNRTIKRVLAGVDKRQRYVRGLFCGGTLCQEAIEIMSAKLKGIHSNVAAPDAIRLDDARESREHTVVDLGDDEFTLGRPHPMIDPSYRNERLLAEARDPETAILLLDVVLGFGSHPDPARDLAPVIARARREAADDGRMLAVIASVTGTTGDPQDLGKQVERLENAGALVFRSNAQAAAFAARLAARLEAAR
jgi:succinyl-CoA synthetase alpha subunit